MRRSLYLVPKVSLIDEMVEMAIEMVSERKMTANILQRGDKVFMCLFAGLNFAIGAAAVDKKNMKIQTGFITI